VDRRVKLGLEKAHMLRKTSLSSGKSIHGEVEKKDKVQNKGERN
jgi:hypothetical protein